MPFHQVDSRWQRLDLVPTCVPRLHFIDSGELRIHFNISGLLLLTCLRNTLQEENEQGRKVFLDKLFKVCDHFKLFDKNCVRMGFFRLQCWGRGKLRRDQAGAVAAVAAELATVLL